MWERELAYITDAWGLFENWLLSQYNIDARLALLGSFQLRHACLHFKYPDAD